ncbi:Phosphatidylethanolamine N-methyltransferase [Ceratocystis platani]|uniref:Phosphatidylethanolamine N-methyltransferase n=1 Tax=Ceratocystis fimbriata f. sp. platani TaxID=88771 RepID=A0A0F8CU95_CERFI|nr:Phosphatidylethanolamine N-methyltransferase [Ceratocystis platani]
MKSSAVASNGTARNRRATAPASRDASTDTVSNSDSHNPALSSEEPSKPQKVYGRTPDGTVFTVPTTHDMVSQLLDPRQPKNLSDLVVLGILALHIFAAMCLPQHLKRPIFALTFIFWRASYNIGIGILLTIQSRYRRLVTLARRWKLFEKPGPDGNQPRPWLYNLLKRELEAKISEDYKFDEAPIEYNTWLVFRRVVDLILMCDFVSYCLFAVVSSRVPNGELPLLAFGRWVVGIFLVAFNLWVKLDAHRVVKDYAWYWGDFFYLVDQELTFDGVFEMAPHPMYSIGYAGYYGISIMAASYDVLFISIIAHLAQMAFLVIVENPHIEKTYDPPPPRVRTASTSKTGDASSESTNSQVSSTPVGSSSVVAKPSSSASIHDMIGWKNFDMYRSTDYTVLLVNFYIAILTVVTPSTPLYKVFFVAHALFWRVWYVAGLGMILRAQSLRKTWTRHFLKYGEGTDEAWRQWKSLSHISMNVCYASFIAACWKLYSPPQDWNYGFVLLKHVIGCGLIALQAWTAFSIYDSLGEFGWFFGDFFFDHEAKLTYKSIYRFLNNPERVLGTAGIWGAALITWSRTVFIMALVSQILVLVIIAVVEKPHMQKIYGRKLRNEAGLTKFIRKSLPLPAHVQTLQQSMDKAFDDTTQFVADFLAAARPKLASGMQDFVKESSILFNAYPARLTITRLAPDLAGFDPKLYSLEVSGTLSSVHGAAKSTTSNTLQLEFGAPINVNWTAPANHKSRDWIGLYKVTSNTSRQVTDVPSQGRWSPTVPGFYDSTISDPSIVFTDRPVAIADPSAPALMSGQVRFEGDKLFWEQGVYEFRYHHDGNHSVMAISQAFEIRINRFADEEDSDLSGVGATTSYYQKEVEAALLPIVQHCLDRDPDIAPATVAEPFGAHVKRHSKYAKRVVYAVQQMFGIEFAPAVVPADGNVHRLAWRICNAKQMLAPYSMSASNGTTTPTTGEYDAEK